MENIISYDIECFSYQRQKGEENKIRQHDVKLAKVCVETKITTDGRKMISIVKKEMEKLELTSPQNETKLI